MSGDNDLIKLYSGQILQLAAAIPHSDRLTSPDATVKKRSPLCGYRRALTCSMQPASLKASFVAHATRSRGSPAVTA